MTREYDISIQPGHVARHTPRNAGAQGREAAVVDIAQDLLLRRLHDDGLLVLITLQNVRHSMSDWHAIPPLTDAPFNPAFVQGFLFRIRLRPQTHP